MLLILNDDGALGSRDMNDRRVSESLPDVTARYLSISPALLPFASLA